VTDVLPESGFDSDELLRLVAGAERGSEHPLGEAIVRSAQQKGLQLAQPSNFLAVAGHGMKPIVKNATSHR
jgi:Cu+-exporting ATPase